MNFPQVRVMIACGLCARTWSMPVSAPFRGEPPQCQWSVAAEDVPAAELPGLQYFKRGIQLQLHYSRVKADADGDAASRLQHQLEQPDIRLLLPLHQRPARGDGT